MVQRSPFSKLLNNSETLSRHTDLASGDTLTQQLRSGPTSDLLRVAISPQTLNTPDLKVREAH